MEHGREVYEGEKMTLKEKLVQGKNWVGDNKERLFIIGLSTAALATYATYHIFEGQSYDGFGDLDSQEKHTL